MKDSQLLFKFCPNSLHPLLRRLTDSVLGMRFAHGAFWTICANIISRGAGLLVSIPIARILGKEGYGEYGIIYSTLVMFSLVVGSGLSLTTAKYVAEFRLHNPNRAGRIIALSNLFSFSISLIVALLLLLMAPWLSIYTIAAPHLSKLLAFSSIGVFLNTLNQVQNGTLVGLEAFKTIANRNLWAGGARFILLLSGTFLWGLPGTVAGFIVSEGFMLVLNQLAIWQHCKSRIITVSYNDCLKEAPILWKFSGPAALAGALGGPVMWICNSILVNGPNGYGEMGLYNMALQWKTFVVFIPLALNNVVLPVLSDLYGKGDRKKHNQILLVNIIFYSVSTCIIALLIALLSPFIIMLYGKEFIAGANVLSIVALSAVFFALNELMFRTLASVEMMWCGFTAMLLSGLIQITLTIIFTGCGWGAYGLGFSTVVAYACTFFVQALFVLKR